MKKLISVLLLIFIIMTAVSCSDSTSSDSTSSDGTSSVETDASTEVWNIGSEKKCSVHHMYYHIIPFDLALYVGLDPANEWAQECQKSSAEADSDCPFSTYNIKAFIDKFEISREVFAPNADLVHYSVFDCEMLYTDTAEEIEQYFTNIDTLADESIKAQNFAFLENYFVSEYTSTVMNMIVTDPTGAHGVSPSIPQIVQAVGMTRSKLEDVIAQMNEKTEEVCGKVMVYEYDLDVIYNEDGSFKELPVFEECSAYETVQKYDCLFCRRDY